MVRTAHFIIPTREGMRPRVIRKLAASDYLCEVKDSRDKTAVTVRVVFVQRNGFRRRRLVTSLLDPIMFPASELARLYHKRWDIETFYRDLKQALRATFWHCQTPETFHQELLVHMIVCCLIRITIIAGSRLRKLSVGQISFTRALTETRLFIRKLPAAAEMDLWATLWIAYVQGCALHLVSYKPGRHFTRDKQEYRRKSRGMEKRRRGRKCTYQEPSQPFQPETHKDAKGQEFLLS